MLAKAATVRPGDGRLRAAGHHRVRLAVTDQVERIADGRARTTPQADTVA
jgi:hypothetical protein